MKNTKLDNFIGILKNILFFNVLQEYNSYKNNN